MTTILYIEDDAGSQVLVQRVLAHAGYDVVLASNALEGIDRARKNPPDLILTDINLPDLSGREITVRLRADHRLTQIPIVALTAVTQDEEREKAFVAGVTGYITKPIDVDTLPDRIQEYLQGRKDKADTGTLAEASRAYHQELVERLEANVRDLEASYRELRRIDQIKDDFIQLTAHELRTPLTTVYGYTRLVQTSPVIQAIMQQDSDVNTCLTGLITAIDRLHSVVNEIITVSRIASGRVDLKPGPTSIREVIEIAVTAYTPVMQQRSLTLTYNSPQWPPQFFADMGLLELAFSNILSNAIKYTPDNGTITISSQIEDKEVHVSIKDTGIGIDPAEQPYIFDRFYTAGDTQLHSTSKTAFRGGGLGLGLAICRGIIEAHGGRIWVESECCDEEKMPGSTFHIVIPLQIELSKPTPPDG